MKSKKKIIIIIAALIAISAITLIAIRLGNDNNKGIEAPKFVEAPKVKVINYDGVEGKNTLELLQSSHTVEAQESSLGIMVKSIDGLASDANNFWLYTVNGESVNVGADKYITKASDKIRWEFKGFY